MAARPEVWPFSDEDAIGLLVPPAYVGLLVRLLDDAARHELETNRTPLHPMLAELRRVAGEAKAASPRPRFVDEPKPGATAAAGDDRWMTTSEAAAALGYSSQHVGRLLAAGRIEGRRHSGVWLVSASAVAAWREP